MFTGYGFFDDTYTLAAKGYAGQDKLSLLQFVVMGVVFALIVVISFLLKKVKKETLFLVYKVMCFVIPVGEIIKISYSTYFDILNGQGFNWGGILPLYACSMIMYFLPFVAFGKSKIKEYSMAFFCTIGLVAGLSNFVYLSAAGYYPIFSYGGLYSVFFHAFIVFVGMSLMITGNYKVDWSSIYKGMVPVLMFGTIVLPVNLILLSLGHVYVDYMMIMDCNGISPLTDWAHSMRDVGLQWLFSLFVLLVLYPIVAALISAIDIGVAKLYSLIFHKKIENEAQASN